MPARVSPAVAACSSGGGRAPDPWVLTERRSARPPPASTRVGRGPSAPLAQARRLTSPPVCFARADSSSLQSVAWPNGPRPSSPGRIPRPQAEPGQAQEFRKRSECEDPFDYIGSSSSWTRSSSKQDLRKGRRNFYRRFGRIFF